MKHLKAHQSTSNITFRTVYTLKEIVNSFVKTYISAKDSGPHILSRVDIAEPSGTTNQSPLASRKSSYLLCQIL